MFRNCQILYSAEYENIDGQNIKMYQYLNNKKTRPYKYETKPESLTIFIYINNINIYIQGDFSKYYKRIGPYTFSIHLNAN